MRFTALVALIGVTSSIKITSLCAATGCAAYPATAAGGSSATATGGYTVPATAGGAATGGYTVPATAAGGAATACPATGC